MEDGEVESEHADLASLVVGELTEPWMDEPYIQHLFGSLGEPLAVCRVARDWSEINQPSLGYAFVQLRSPRAARHVMHERSATIPTLHPYRYLLRPAKAACTVYVGQLDMPWACQAMLRYLFPDEAIAKIHLPTDEHGRPRNYGFVTFTTDADAQRVMKMCDAHLAPADTESDRHASTALSTRMS